MITLTFSQYDKMIEGFENIKLKPFWPTKDQVKVMEGEPERWLKYALFLDQQKTLPKTTEEILGKHVLRDFINRNLELIEDDEETEQLTMADIQEILNNMSNGNKVSCL